jgi:hypothetical protein
MFPALLQANGIAPAPTPAPASPSPPLPPRAPPIQRATSPDVEIKDEENQDGTDNSDEIRRLQVRPLPLRIAFAFRYKGNMRPSH